MRFDVGDTVEFELGPDGFNSRYPQHGPGRDKTDRGATGKWLRGTVVTIERDKDTGINAYKVEAISGDIYYFDSPGELYYPKSAIRLVSKLKSGKIRMVDKGGHWVTEEVK